MDKKRLVLIILFILATIGIALLLYWVFFAGKIGPQPISEEQPSGEVEFPEAEEGALTRPTVGPSQQLPLTDGVAPGVQVAPAAQEESKLKRIVEDQVTGARVDSNNAVSFYNELDGRFYRVDAGGNMQQLSDTIFYNVENVVWAQQNNAAVLEYPDGSNIYYNFDSGEQVTLPKHWEDFSFSRQADQIAAKSIGLSPDNRWLVTTNVSGSNIQLVEPLGENADKVIVDWSPNRQVVALSRTGDPLGADRQQVLFVGLNGENFPAIVVEGRGLETKWSPTGNQLLYSVYSARTDFKPELWIVNADPQTMGTNRSVLNLNTWSDKCAFAGERTVYCAVPTELDAGSGFSPALADGTPDRLMKIDVLTGAQIEVPLSESHVVDSISVDEKTQTVYFTDKQQPGLFRVSL